MMPDKQNNYLPVEASLDKDMTLTEHLAELRSCSHPPAPGYYKSGTAALHQGCAIYSADPALLHGRLRQLWRQLSWQLNHHRFFSNAR